MVDGAPPQEPSSRPFEGALAIMASAFAAFDAEVAPRIPADGLSPVSQEDLRLKTPALRPVGCWWSGCARPAPPAGTPMLADAPAAALAQSRHCASRAQVLQPVRCDGGGPAAAAVLRLRHCALLLRGVPQGSLARGPQGRLQARARQACRHGRPVLRGCHLFEPEALHAGLCDV